MESEYSSEEHGGMDAGELKRYAISPDRLIDFSVNINPFGPSPKVIEAIRKVDITRYPDRHCCELRERLGDLNNTPARQILVGNGTAELIWLIAQTFLKPGDKILIVGPTFGEYRRAAAKMGTFIEEIRAQAPTFLPPLNLVDRYVRQHQPRLVFLCNPNNPSGKNIALERIGRLLEECGSETIFVLDEAYRAFLGAGFFGGILGKNCLVLRSMTKDFALAGLRLGYVMGESEYIDEISAVQPAWSVNTCAQAAGMAALADLEYYSRTIGELERLRVDFNADLQARGYRLVQSDVHFRLISLGYPAATLRARLMASAIQVRDCASFGLPEHVRISTRLDEDNQRLLTALSSIRFEKTS